MISEFLLIPCFLLLSLLIYRLLDHLPEVQETNTFPRYNKRKLRIGMDSPFLLPLARRSVSLLDGEASFFEGEKKELDRRLKDQKLDLVLSSSTLPSGKRELRFSYYPAAQNCNETLLEPLDTREQSLILSSSSALSEEDWQCLCRACQEGKL